MKHWCPAILHDVTNLSAKPIVDFCESVEIESPASSGVLLHFPIWKLELWLSELNGTQHKPWKLQACWQWHYATVY